MPVTPYRPAVLLTGVTALAALLVGCGEHEEGGDRPAATASSSDPLVAELTDPGDDRLVDGDRSFDVLVHARTVTARSAPGRSRTYAVVLYGPPGLPDTPTERLQDLAQVAGSLQYDDQPLAEI